MSVRAMATVWESSLAPPSLKLTALAMADWSNDDGGSLHPSMSAIHVGIFKPDEPMGGGLRLVKAAASTKEGDGND